MVKRGQEERNAGTADGGERQGGFRRELSQVKISPEPRFKQDCHSPLPAAPGH